MKGNLNIDFSGAAGRPVQRYFEQPGPVRMVEAEGIPGARQVEAAAAQGVGDGDGDGDGDGNGDGESGGAAASLSWAWAWRERGVGRGGKEAVVIGNGGELVGGMGERIVDADAQRRCLIDSGLARPGLTAFALFRDFGSMRIAFDGGILRDWQIGYLHFFKILFLRRCSSARRNSFGLEQSCFKA